MGRLDAIAGLAVSAMVGENFSSCVQRQDLVGTGLCIKNENQMPKSWRVSEGNVKSTRQALLLQLFRERLGHTPPAGGDPPPPEQSKPLC